MAALDSLLGNETLKESLSAALAAGRLSHSILLCGEAGTGAGFAARCLAADYLYPNGGASAAQVLAGQSPEYLLLAGEGVSGDIRVDRVREVRREIFNTALSAGGRAVHIKGADKLNGASANALLKVLEEPPEGVLFILTAPSEANVMATIRCCAYSLAPVAEEVCAAYLKKHFPKEPEAARYAALFGGKIGSAKRCLEDAAGRTLLLDALKLAGLAEKQDVYGALALLSKYEKDRAGTQALLGLLLNVCSASLRGSEAAQSPVSPARAARCAGEAGKTARLLAGNVSGKLALTWEGFAGGRRLCADISSPRPHSLDKTPLQMPRAAELTPIAAAAKGKKL